MEVTRLNIWLISQKNPQKSPDNLLDNLKTHIFPLSEQKWLLLYYTINHV